MKRFRVSRYTDIILSLKKEKYILISYQNSLVLFIFSIVNIISTLGFPVKAAPKSIPSLERSQHHVLGAVPLSESWQFAPDTSLPRASLLDLKPNPLALPPSNSLHWKKIAVPSNWYLSNHDLSGVVWYRHQFAGNSRLQGKKVQLVFEGVDYASDVWLNGKYLGFHEGYFQPFRFDVSKFLRADRPNILLVRVNSPKEIETSDWSLHKRLIKGVLAHHDARPGSAWTDKGQDRNTGGIWASVYLKVSNAVSIEQVKVTPHLNLDRNQGIAEVKLNLNYLGKTNSKVNLQFQISPDNFVGEREPSKNIVVRLKPGSNRVMVRIQVNSAKQWETWEQGTPSLYRLTVQALEDNRISDQVNQTFGFRTISFDAQEKVWKLNGKRLFIRGTNYIASQWLGEMTSEKYQADIDLMKKANINAIRVHAHIAGQAFYDLIDRAGLLVWQDFPLQWGYIEDPAFTAEAIKQAKEMVDLLYNHPSIMTWSLHNEPPSDATWMKYKYKSYDPQQNRSLDQQLYTNLRDYDPTRYLNPYSGVKEHPWWGWYSFTYQKYAEPTSESIISEFGAQALPDLRSLRRIFSEAELWPNTEVEWKKWEYHNFQRHETFNIAKVSMGKTPEEFVNNTQRYQAEVNQFAAESYRRQRYQPVSAIFQFMFAECWPSMNWGIVDYWRNPKLGYSALQQAYQPILPMLDKPQRSGFVGNNIPLDFWVINDLWRTFPRSQLIYMLLKNRLVLKTGSIPISLNPDSQLRISRPGYLPTSEGRYELQLKVVDEKENFLGQNSYTFDIHKPSR